MKVDVKETTFVCPATETPKGTLWLSDFDLFHANIHNLSLHFFKPKSDETYPKSDEITRVLKKSLAETLISFYPLAGRLGKDENGRIQIDCNAKGTLFVVAEADCSLDELLDGELCPNSNFEQLRPKVDYSQHISTYPLNITQVTHFKCGGICLCTGNHHMVADGLSAMHLINSWANIARGLPFDPPLHDRKLLDDLALPSPKFPHPEFDASAIFSGLKLPQSPLVTSTAYLKISPKLINSLKDKANADANADADAKKYSVYESLVSHVWRCVCEARGLSDDQKTWLYIAVDARSRLRPPIPKELFANVVQTLAPAACAGDIVKQPLSSTAGRIRRAIKEVEDEYVRSGLAYLRDNPNAIEGLTGRPISQNPNLSIVSWTQMPMYEADFGWGKPFYAAPASIRGDGKGYLLSGPTKEEGLSLYICLESQYIELFKKLFYEV